MRNLSWSSCWGQHKKSTATSAPTFIWRVRWKISKSTNHSSDYVCDVIWRQRLRASRGRLNLSAILPNRPADSRAKRVDSPGCWTLAFAFKALPIACFTADLLSIYFCAVRLICAGFRHLCERFRSCLHTSIPFSLVRLRFVQVEFTCTWFDLSLRRLTFWWIHLFLRGSIYIWASLICLHEVRFIFWPFNNVCTRFILLILWLEDFGRNGTP